MPNDISVRTTICNCNIHYHVILLKADHVMLVKNAQNLMEAVIKMIREAETVCMKVITISLNLHSKVFIILL